MPDKSYQPIACADYDTYEIAIMQGRLLMLKWEIESGEVIVQPVKPIKLKIVEGAEYLFFEHQHKKTLKIRLDKIIGAEIIRT